MNRLGTATIRDLLPPNLKSKPEAIAASAAIAPEFQRLFHMARNVLVFADIDNLAEPWLDLLAIDMHVDYFDAALSIEKKRELVKQSIPMHQKKGTPWAVEELIKIVFGPGYTEEWFEYGGEPYHFKVYTTNQLVTPEDGRKFRDALNSAKNVRSWLDEIVVIRTWETIYNNYSSWEDVYNSFDSWQAVMGSL